MAKNSAAATTNRSGTARDQSPVSRGWPKRKGAQREILFPTEPSTIGRRKIARAVDRVVARKK